MADPPVASLDLADIIRLTTSPPPRPQILLAPEINSVGRSNQDPAGNEQPDEEIDVLAQLETMGLVKRSENGAFTQAQSTGATPREQELMNMLLKLISDHPSSPPDAAQLLRQAEVIVTLTAQRSFLLAEIAEERARFEAEREGWERISEALIRRASDKVSENGESTDIDQRIRVNEADNRALRQKLSDTQSRLHTIESELSRLRPLLLMQPSDALSSHFDLKDKDTAKQSKRSKGKERERGLGSRKEKERDGTDVDDLTEGQDEEARKRENVAAGEAGPSSRPGLTSKPSKARVRERESDRHTKRRQALSRKGLPLLSDARAEHLLLAARRIGRERAGLVQARQTEREQGKERQGEKEHDRVQMDKEREPQHESQVQLQNPPTTPKTPRRTTTAMPPAALLTPTHPGYLYSPVFVPAYQIMQTPRPRHPQGPGSVQQHPPSTGGTPLDSLLSAARSMMDDSPGSTVNVSGSRRPLEEPESPVPKRRKISGNKTAHFSPAPLSAARERGSPEPGSARRPGESSDTGRERVMSALDVLADQAVSSSKEQGSSREAAHGDAEFGARPQSSRQTRAATRNGRVYDESRSGESKVRSRAKGKVRERSPQEDEHFNAGPSPESTTRRIPLPRSPLIARLGPVANWTAETDSSSPLRSEESQTRIGDPLLESRKATQPSEMSLLRPPSRPVTASPRPRTPISPSPPQIPPRGVPRTQTPPRYDQKSIQHSEDASMQGEPHQCIGKSSEPPVSEQSPVVAPIPTVPRLPASTSRSQSVRPPNSNGHTTEDHTSPLDDALPFERPAGKRRAASIPPKVRERSADRTEHELAPSRETFTLHSSELERVAEDYSLSSAGASLLPGKKPRSPYVKWSKEEDDLLAQAVAKYGQKWDLVSKALPSRGYHQVRQRWLRKLGLFDSKADLSSLQGTSTRASSADSHLPANIAALGISTSPAASSASEPPANLKLGLAPLSSELAFTSFPRAQDAPDGAGS